MIDVILADVQYMHKEVMHFFTSSMMKELVSWDFLKSLTNIVSRNGSMAFFRA
jgi:hypothetical protein